MKLIDEHGHLVLSCDWCGDFCIDEHLIPAWIIIIEPVYKSFCSKKCRHEYDTIEKKEKYNEQETYNKALAEEKLINHKITLCNILNNLGSDVSFKYSENNHTGLSSIFINNIELDDANLNFNKVVDSIILRVGKL